MYFGGVGFRCSILARSHFLFSLTLVRRFGLVVLLNPTTPRKKDKNSHYRFFRPYDLSLYTRMIYSIAVGFAIRNLAIPPYTTYNHYRPSLSSLVVRFHPFFPFSSSRAIPNFTSSASFVMVNPSCLVYTDFYLFFRYENRGFTNDALLSAA